MLDIKFIKENKELVQLAAKKKRMKFDVEDLMKVEHDRLEIGQQVEELRSKQNKASEEIAKASPEIRDILIKGMTDLKSELKYKEDKLSEIMKSWRELMLQVPNIPDMSVPPKQLFWDLSW